MRQYLPYGKFKWCNVKEMTTHDTETGYILEVGLKYPKELHDYHSDIPLAPENRIQDSSNQSKLITACNNNNNVIHYRNLIKCQEMELKVRKVHIVLEFKQSKWLKKYIDLNTKMRTNAKNDFEKDFYKLMNNSVFGKTMENIRRELISSYVVMLKRLRN
ncbi:uncharacterized protein LOC111631015 [Centruroides sculpturatus]|uniref:uncharacterized protein LOC111631015 n=1 Tax=Centruroides sculpturatus TaxID=218467 RepID=UPI000C6CA515|nr:uncharacterized protein LOC111631015 [Centruroides sculpturatus]